MTLVGCLWRLDRRRKRRSAGPGILNELGIIHTGVMFVLLLLMDFVEYDGATMFCF